MKFGERLEKEKHPQWMNFYIDYNQLKEMILELETQERYKGAEDMEQQNTSLSVPLPTDSSGTPVSKRTFSVDETHITQETFFQFLEQVGSICFMQSCLLCFNSCMNILSKTFVGNFQNQ